MKTTILLLMIVASVILADTYTTTVSDPAEDARFKIAAGVRFNKGVDASGSPIPATVRECNYLIGAYVKQITQDYERSQAIAQYTPAPVNPSPAPVSPTPAAAAVKKK